MADVIGTIQVSGTTSEAVNQTTISGATAIMPVTQPWVNGASVSGGNPLPTADATTEAALATANGYLATMASGGGSATAGNQTAGNTTLVSILSALGSTATEAIQTAGNTLLSAISGYLATLAGAVSAGKIAVTGTFWQTTQPVSLSALPALPAGAAAIGSVSVSNLPSTQAVSIAAMPTTAVTGAFYQATQPVSLASAPTTPVTGTFWQTTQPVSLAALPALTVSNFPATQPVSVAALPALAAGAAAIGSVTVSNLPSTQAVSIAAMPTTPVTGTFWQTSQAVQGTTAVGSPPSQPPLSVSGVDGSGNKQHLLTDTGGRAQVGVTNWPATQPISVAALPALAAGANAIGTVGVTTLPALPAGTNLIGKAGIDQTTPGTTNGVVVTTALPAGTNQLGLVTAGGFTAQIQVVPTVQAAAYAAGATVGGLLTFAAAARISAGSGFAQAATVAFHSGVVPNLDLFLFTANPTASTITDKVAVAVATADEAKVFGVINISSGTLLGATAPSFNQGETQAMPFKLPSGTTVYGALVTRTAITLTSTSDATVTLSVLQD